MSVRDHLEGARSIAVAIASPALPAIDAALAEYDGAYPPSSPQPGWRAGRAIGDVWTLPGTERMSGYVTKPNNADANYLVNPWICYAFDEDADVWWLPIGAAGGHSNVVGMDWQNPCLRASLGADVVGWAVHDPGSDYVDVVDPATGKVNERYLDGRWQSRHSYYSCVQVGAGKAWDARQHLMMFGAYAAYSQDMPSTWKAGPQVHSMLVDPAHWFAHGPNGTHVHGCELPGTVPNVPNWNGHSAAEAILGVCQDPDTHDVYTDGHEPPGYKTLRRWVARTNTWSQVLVTSQTPAHSQFRAANNMPSLFDRARRMHVKLYHDYYNNTKRLIRTTVDAPHVVSVVPLSTQAPRVSSASLVHVLDWDRYVLVTTETASPYRAQAWTIHPDTGQTTLIATLLSAVPAIYRAAWSKRTGTLFVLGQYKNPIECIATR